MAYELLKRELKYSGRIFEFSIDQVLFQSGATVELEVIHHRGGAAVVALTDDNQVVLVKQYRHPMGEYVLELPAGKIDLGHTAEQTAINELAQEAGFKAKSLKLLTTSYPAPGYSGERLYIYLAEGLEIVERHPDFDEEIEVIYLPFKKACEMIFTGEIRDAKTIIGLLTTLHLQISVK
ncbi:MAG: NUDIX hydrolase [Acidobacteria bacterium]|nr:NUDIX hydrolase [Acidobacteriota bacterium]